MSGLIRTEVNRGEVPLNTDKCNLGGTSAVDWKGCKEPGNHAWGLCWTCAQHLFSPDINWEGAAMPIWSRVCDRAYLVRTESHCRTGFSSGRPYAVSSYDKINKYWPFFCIECFGLVEDPGATLPTKFDAS